MVIVLVFVLLFICGISIGDSDLLFIGGLPLFVAITCCILALKGERDLEKQLRDPAKAKRIEELMWKINRR